MKVIESLNVYIFLHWLDFFDKIQGKLVYIECFTQKLSIKNMQIYQIETKILFLLNKVPLKDLKPAFWEKLSVSKHVFAKLKSHGFIFLKNKSHSTKILFTENIIENST